METDWAIKELKAYIEACEDMSSEWDAHETATSRFVAAQDEVSARTQIVERIADRAWPEWRNHLPQRTPMSWEHEPLKEIARRALPLLEREAELREKLGEAGPNVSAGSFHPDVWQAAQSLWRSKHFGDAVKAAARGVNAMLQAKVERRDACDAKLVGESFNLKLPAAGQPRLRLMDDELVRCGTGTPAFSSGVMSASKALRTMRRRYVRAIAVSLGLLASEVHREGGAARHRSRCGPGEGRRLRRSMRSLGSIAP